jgi:exodeoxyribonuclease V alpha subunit
VVDAGDGALVAAFALGTRQTLYMAVTRDHVRVIGYGAALPAAVDRPAARASGLRERLQHAK